MEKWDFFTHKMGSGKIHLPCGNEKMKGGNKKVACCVSKLG